MSAPSTFADFILLHARVQPQRPAIILSDRVATYEMLAQGMMRVEARVRALNLRPGEPVCIALESPIRHMILAAALARLGHPTVSANTVGDVLSLGLPIAAYLREAGGVVFGGARMIPVDSDWFAGEPMRLAMPGSAGFADDSAICRIEITSGSTGRPKAVCATVREFSAFTGLNHVTLNMGHWDRVLCLIGLNTASGFAFAAHALMVGKTLVCAEAPRQALEMISIYNVDAMVASTQQARDVLLSQKRAPIACPSLRAMVLGGGLPTRAILLELRARLCERIFIQYSATEVGRMAFASADRLMDVEGATGFALPGATLEIVDEADQPVAEGRIGVVRARTGWQARPWPPGSQHPGFRDGWFYPGDRGRVTPEGLLVLEGRATEVINSGGVKIAPELVEEVVEAHPNVAEVAAFGALGPDGIEEIHLAIVARAPIAEPQLIDWCAQRRLKIARVLTLEALPKTPMGKIRREDLKKLLSH